MTLFTYPRHSQAARYDTSITHCILDQRTNHRVELRITQHSTPVTHEVVMRPYVHVVPHSTVMCRWRQLQLTVLKQARRNPMHRGGADTGKLLAQRQTNLCIGRVTNVMHISTYGCHVSCGTIKRLPCRRVSHHHASCSSHSAC